MIDASLSPWLGFILVLARILSFITTAPIISRRSIPALSKIGFSIFISLLVFAGNTPNFTGSNAEFIAEIILETAIGLTAGTLANWLFQSFTMGGQLIDQQAGFGSASMFDPGSAMQVSLISNLILYISILLFFELNGHHILFFGLVRSFAIVPVGLGSVGITLSAVVLRVLSASTVLLIRVAVPVVVILVVTDLILGMVGRTVPQLNILMLGLPVKAAVALLVLAAVSPVFLSVGESLISELETVLGKVIGVMAP